MNLRMPLLLTMLAVSACAGAPGAPVPLAQGVNLDRMYGGWYIVATIPNWFERGMVAPYDEYSRRPDGDIQEDFYIRRGSFASPRKHFTVHDWVRPGTHNAHWRVQVLWPINLPFLLLYVDPDYRYALFGENSRSLGWIYSREPTLSDEAYRYLLATFAERGYDPTRFRRVIQQREQIGLSGYWNDRIEGGPE